MINKCCSNCDYCAENNEDLVCVNANSEYVADFVETNHVCDDWEGEANEDS